MAATSQSIHHRFWSKVHVTNGCWLWTRCRRKDGYGKLGLFGEIVYAHRVAWLLTNGPIPKGLCVLHHCDNPPCCNPDHLFLGTRADNATDRDTKGRTRGGNSGRTHCKRGHPFNTRNTYWRPDGGRDCRTCAASHHRKYRRQASRVSTRTA